MRTLLASLFVLTLAFPASAAFEGPGVLNASPTESVLSASQAMRAPDNAPCVLEGHITSRLAKEEHYRFQDASGTIPVDIDDELFEGRRVTPEDRVRLTGEVDVNDCGDREVDVKRLEILR